MNYIDRMLKSNLLNYSLNKYAPESFQLKINSELVKNTPDEFGYICITKGHKELIKALKKWFRNKTIFGKNTSQKMYLKTSEGFNVTIQNGFVNPYDAEEKLNLYKFMKETYIKENNIIIEEGTFNPSLKNNKVKKVVSLKHGNIVSVKIF